MLLALLREEAKAQVVDLGICADQKESLDKVVQNAFERVDVLITSGGVSMVSL
jgi:molybdopterin biosynthesis enzyme